MRLRESPFTQLEPLVQHLASVLLPLLDKPFVFFGHSMGGLVSFELTRLLRTEYGVSPVHLFVSGHRAPQVPDPDPPIHTLPKSEFLQELRFTAAAFVDWGGYFWVAIANFAPLT
jgi:medium-chain acyl-[acyl-carrier-protein] hydrolase